jgi:hypothetical protein
MDEPITDGLPVRLQDEALDLLGQGGDSHICPMQGWSMVPTLKDGQRVAVSLSTDELTRGDLLLFRQVDYLVVHRFLGNTTGPNGEPCLRTRGDGRIALDPPLDPAKVRGVVVAIEDDGYWWDLRGGGAKLYAIGVFLHDFFWAVAGMNARKLEGTLRKIGIALSAVDLAERVDRALLGFVHRLLFKPLHARYTLPLR